MNFLEERIAKEGKVINNDILKVDGFINQKVNGELMMKIAKCFSEHFANNRITKVITIEASGIAPALLTAMELNVPMVILKKQQSKTLNENIYQTSVKSFTKNNVYSLVVSKEFINDDDNILIIDDFLANGEAASGAIRLIKNTKASIAGIGIVIEKTFQPGRKKLEEQGYDVYSIARIKSLENNTVEFMKE